jgi:UDP-3-O-[3-hydroxymyristoyl] glucosamine N-acyltransferase
MFKLTEIATVAGGKLKGNGEDLITGIATLHSAGPDEISFFTNPHYRQVLQNTRAGAVILAQDHVELCPVNCVIAANPQLAYSRVAALFVPDEISPQGVHPNAWVSEQATVAASAWIGPCSVVEAGAVIGEGVFVGPNCSIGPHVTIGPDSRLLARVTLCKGVCLGRRVLIHPGAVIGSDGFGLANDQGIWIKIPQLGSVLIGDDVEIGANTTVDRGALEDTVLEQGVKLDNQIQVAHNVHIGAHTAIAGCVGIAGSARIGSYCTIGGGVGIAGHLEIADNVHITGMSLVAQSITEPGVYSSGLTVEPNRIWNKISARLRRIDDIARKLIALEKRISGDKCDIVKPIKNDK